LLQVSAVVFVMTS